MDDPKTKKEYEKTQWGAPYLKYQWGVYRSVLDVLRNNQKLDPLYQETVERAIKYCVSLGRTNEYHKLCDLCRRHLKAVYEHQEQNNKVEIYTPEMLGVYLNTRFKLLENATKLKMWQEAFKLITDIHNLQEKSKEKTELDSSLMLIYYRKLSEIFLQSENYLLHGYSLLKYYGLERDAFEDEQRRLIGLDPKKAKKTKERSTVLTMEEIQMIGQKCVLATLSAPEPRARSDLMGPPLTPENKKHKIMAEQLNFHTRPNRDELMRQLEYEELLDVTDDLRNLRTLICDKFAPLTLCKEVTEILDKIMAANPQFERYREPIKSACANRLIIQISEMYSTCPFEKIKNLFFEDWTQRRIEKLIIDIVDEGYIWCRMSHQRGICIFRPPDRLERNTFMKEYLAKLSIKLTGLYENQWAPVGGVNRQVLFDDVRKGVV
eukprot:UN32275